jgi:uncharacterized protein (DUF2062 family)
MIRKVFKKKRPSGKLEQFMQKYHLPQELFAVNRRTVSKALLVGLFIGLIPIPAQMVVIVLLAPVLRFNVFIGLLMVWVTNPVTMPFIFYAEYELGRLVLMQEEIEGIEMSLEWFTEHLGEIVVPLYAGALLMASAVSVTAYTLANRLWVRSVKKEQARRG